jgi:hypothetical protein
MRTARLIVALPQMPITRVTPNREIGAGKRLYARVPAVQVRSPS